MKKHKCRNCSIQHPLYPPIPPPTGPRCCNWVSSFSGLPGTAGREKEKTGSALEKVSKVTVKYWDHTGKTMETETYVLIQAISLSVWVWQTQFLNPALIVPASTVTFYRLTTFRANSRNEAHIKSAFGGDFFLQKHQMCRTGDPQAGLRNFSLELCQIILTYFILKLVRLKSFFLRTV